jgi:hypothetical protein
MPFNVILAVLFLLAALASYLASSLQKRARAPLDLP